MFASLIIHVAANQDGTHDLVSDLWLTGMVYLFSVVAVSLVAYLIFTKKPDSEVVFGALMGGVMASLAWPLVVAVGVFSGIIYGSRWVVHEWKKPTLSPRKRKQVRLAKLSEEIKRLEAELELSD